MHTLLVSYTLPKPGQDYDAVHEILRLSAIRIAHADAGLWYLQTNYTEANLEALLKTVMDSNDSFVIWGPNVRPYNRSIKWERGAQSTPSEAMNARNTLRSLLVQKSKA